MKQLSITYINNLLPYIQITHNGLHINKHYASQVDDNYLKGILSEQGFDVSDWLIEAIKDYSRLPNQEKNVTVVFDMD